jgi:signal transduction protein with GAF and PtsI domain
MRPSSEAFRGTQWLLLEQVAVGVALPDVLDGIVRFIEAQSDEMKCSILLLDRDGTTLRHGAASSLPELYTKAIDGSQIGPAAGSCGTAAFRREPVIVESIETHP